jgi:hypothetical protein
MAYSWFVKSARIKKFLIYRPITFSCIVQTGCFFLFTRFIICFTHKIYNKCIIGTSDLSIYFIVPRNYLIDFY